MGCNACMDFGKMALINGDVVSETEKKPILDPREGLFLKCLLCLY